MVSARPSSEDALAWPPDRDNPRVSLFLPTMYGPACFSLVPPSTAASVLFSRPAPATQLLAQSGMSHPRPSRGDKQIRRCENKECVCERVWLLDEG